MTTDSHIAEQGSGFQRTIGVGQGIALYTSAILGAGVLVLPGQAAAMGGPASLLAWIFSCILGIPLAFTFARLARAVPDAGGIATYTARAFGVNAGGVTGWLYFVAGSVGQTVVPLTGGYYLAEALGVSSNWAYAFGAGILLIAFVANMFGMKLSGRVQIVLAAGVALILAVAIVLAIPDIDFAAFTPFAPHGLGGVGSALLILFFAFAGWEAVAHLAEEFKDPARGIWKSTIVTIILVSVLYVGIAVAVIGTQTYGDDHTNRLSIGLIVEGSLGFNATVATAVVALVICIGTTNAFIASISRLGYALARDRWLPHRLSHINSTGQPRWAITGVTVIGGTGLAIGAIFHLGTETIVLVPSTLVVFVYLAGMLAAVKILPPRSRWLPIVGVALIAVVVPFTVRYLWIPIAVIIIAGIFRFWCNNSSKREALAPVEPIS